MKKHFFLIAFIAAVAISNAQQIQNEGFETWSGAFPTNWGTLGNWFVDSGYANPNLDVQSTMAHSGNYSIKLQNQSTPEGMNAGVVCAGHFITNSTGRPDIGKIPYTSIPDSFDFWYQFNAINNDTAAASLICFHSGTKIAQGTIPIIGATSGWVHISAPVNISISGQTPDSIEVIFASSFKEFESEQSFIPAGGWLYVDDVHIGAYTNTNAPPAAPTNLLAAPGKRESNDVMLTWTDNANNETGFKVERSANGTNFTQIEDIPTANTQSYDDVSISAGTTYYYRVSAYNSAGSSAYSNVAQASTAVSGITDVNSETTIGIFPNPSNGIFTITSTLPQQGVVEVYNVTGEKVFSLNASTLNRAEINLSQQTKGIYLVKIISAENIFTKQITIE